MSWTSIIGHDRPKKILQEALAHSQVAHAYLFHGEDSIGKWAMARTFTQAIQCERQNGSNACGDCRPCRAIESDIHPDVRTIQPEGSQIKIDQIRTIQGTLAFKPITGVRKIILLNEADSMNLQAANCFLKTLEEPPDHSLLILVTSRPYRLLPTILSRCQQIRFDPPRRENIARLLLEQRNLSEAEADLLAALSLGRIGSALTTNLDELQAQRDGALDLVSDKALSDLHQLFGNAQAHAADEDTWSTTLDWILIWLRDLLVYQHNRDPGLLINLDRQQELARYSQRFSTTSLLRIMTLLAAFQRATRRNLNRTMVLETVLLELRDSLRKATG